MDLHIEVNFKFSPLRIILETGHLGLRGYRVAWIAGPITKRRDVPMFILKDDERFKLTAAISEDTGQPAVLDGPPSWSSNDPTIATVAPDPNDPLSATVSSVGPEGSVTITMTGDADLGAGVTPISATFDIQVIPSGASVVTFTAGVPENRLTPTVV